MKHSSSTTIYTIATIMVSIASLAFFATSASATSLPTVDIAATTVETETSPLYSDQEFLEAIRWMNEQSYTRYSTPEHYRPFDVVSRQEWAHFLSTFASQELGTVIDTGKYCSFDDIDDADPTLKNSILVSCLLHLFKWSNGMFSPLESMTKAQVLAVLVRGIDGFRNENWAIWRQDYYEQSYERGLTREADPAKVDVPVSRYEMALLLVRASEFVAWGQVPLWQPESEEEDDTSADDTPDVEEKDLSPPDEETIEDKTSDTPNEDTPLSDPVETATWDQDLPEDTETPTISFINSSSNV